MLELEFLSLNNYNIYISLEELQQYGDQLLMHSIREKEKYTLFEYSQKNNLNIQPHINYNDPHLYYVDK